MKQYNIIWTTESLSDLSEYIKFVLNVSQKATITLREEIYDSILELSYFPEKNQVFEMNSSFPHIVRKHIINKRYIALYTVEKNDVVIYRILDARKKFSSMLM